MVERSEDEVRQEVRRRQAEIELLGLQARDRGLKFAALNEEELIRKASRPSAGSPYIFTESWTSGTTAGSAASYSLSVANPDPAAYYSLFVTIFFGMANFLADIGPGPAGRDTEWPYLSSAPFAVASGASVTQSFNYRTPTSVPAGTYTGNAVLWLGSYLDQGTYFDRGLFDVTLT